MPNWLPLLVEPEQLDSQLDDPNLVIVDVGRLPSYATHHVPGALHLEYAALVSSKPPVMGLLPDLLQFQSTLEALGIGANTQVVTYDDEGGGKASRFLYTLECIGHSHVSLLNGGIHAWVNEHHPIHTDRVLTEKSSYPLTLFNPGPIADKKFILEHLQDPQTICLDTRTAGEYSGFDVRAARGGHIPGAIHLDWTDNLDRERNNRLKPAAEIATLLQSRGIDRDKTIITYCQTHHRSSHTYMVLRNLGYEQVKGYPGAWSDWGNDADTPIESEAA